MQQDNNNYKPPATDSNRILKKIPFFFAKLRMLLSLLC